MAKSAALFRTVAAEDYLGFWVNHTLKARDVAEFLNLDKREVAKLAHVAPASVRYDDKIPKDVLDRLQEIANVCSLVAQHFKGDVTKTALWFKTKNPLFGDISPRDMIRFGRTQKLRRFIVDAMTKNAAAAPPPKRQGGAGTVHPMLAAHRAAIETLCRRHAVRQLALFGSALDERFDPATSDVDLVVEFAVAPGVSPARQYFDFKTELETLLGTPVDLIELKAMPDTRLKRIIERTQVPLYAEAA